MPKGKKVEFRADGVKPETPKNMENVIITISSAKGYQPSPPFSRINILGMPSDKVVAFITGAISYALARYGSLDASNWEDTPKLEGKDGKQ